MSILQALVYGVVQGLTEFLPVSSTAHLVLIPWLFGWQPMGTAFDVALHLGTAAAVILFFFKDWIRLVRAGFTKPSSTDGRLFWFLVLATIPGGIAGVLLDQYMNVFDNPALIGAMLILMGVLLYLADRFGRSEAALEAVGLKRTVLVGLAQVLAIIPGVSRSGVTMTTGRALGMTRDGIARFTFLLSAPIILLDGLYHATKILHDPIPALPFAVSIVAAGVVGALAIGFLLNFLRRKGFLAFAVYRFVLGAAVIAIYFAR